MDDLSEAEQRYYQELDAKAEAGELDGLHRVSHDPNAGADFLMKATGTDNIDDAQREALRA